MIGILQEQAPGVYKKSLRNMWVGVTCFNPLISLLALCVFSVHDIVVRKETLLAEMGLKVGSWMGQVGGHDLGVVLKVWLSLDAFVVLSGAVLTAYVGVNGLMKRLALDRVLPQVCDSQIGLFVVYFLYIICLYYISQTAGWG